MQQQQLLHSSEKETIIEAPDGAAAFLGGLGPPTAAAPIPDLEWLPRQLALLDLRRAEMNTPTLEGLELFQIADIYDRFQQRKRRFPKDIAKLRKASPSIEVWRWFADDVQNFGEWAAIADKAQKTNVMHRSYAVERANDAQRPNTQIHEEWEEHVAEGMVGHALPRNETFYRGKFPTMPAAWAVVPRWMRAIIWANYRPASLASKKGKAP